MIYRQVFLLCLAISVFSSVSGQDLLYIKEQSRRIPVLKTKADKNLIIPPQTDNSLNTFFPPLFSQEGFSCEQMAGVSFAYAYEVNRLRNISSRLWENCYPAKYTWNFMNNGEEFKGVNFFYSFDVLKRQGHPTCDVYPNSESMGHLGWMSGYDRYFAGMKNRLKNVYSIPVNTEEGILTLKQYLYNHLDNSATGGIAVFSASAAFNSGGNIFTIPFNSPEPGKNILTGFYPVATHGMVIVGYNDSIRFDINGDGQFTNNIDITGDGITDRKDWEIGAYRMANTYGSWWEDNGFLWIMYRAMALGYDDGLPTWSAGCGVWNQSVYILDPDTGYSPLLTMKVKLDNSIRNTISVKAGISQDPHSSIPEHILEFPFWNFMGSTYPANVLQPEIEEMEIGFDITPLLSWVEKGKACKLFYILENDDPWKTAIGKTAGVDFISYDGGTEIIHADGENVAIKNGGHIISAEFTPSYNKVDVTTDELPAFSPQWPYSIQLNADGGKPPYKWDLLHPFKKIPVSDEFPEIFQHEVTPQSILIPYFPIPLPFNFRFYGKVYDTAYMNAYGFISFNPDQIPYNFIVDNEEMMRNNVLIAPLLSMKNYFGDPYGKMWYETSEDHVIFHWRTKISGNELSSNLDFALKIYSDGRFEFFYDDCHNLFSPFSFYSGHSAGDNIDFETSCERDLTQISGKSFLFEPEYLVPYINLSSSGTLSVTQAADTSICDISVRVADENNLFSVRKLGFTSSLSIELTTKVPGLRIGKDGPENIGLLLKNKSDQPIGSLSLTLSGPAGISVTDSVEVIQYISAGSEKEIPGAFTVSVDSAFPDRSNLPFIIRAETGDKTWQKKEFFTFSAPDLRISEPVIDDGVDAFLDPGEVAEMEIILSNFGSSKLNDVEITLVSDTLAEILSDTIMFRDSIAAGDTVRLVYLMKASKFASGGDTCRLSLKVHDTTGFSKDFPLFITTGKYPVAVLTLSQDYFSSSLMVLALDQLGIKNSTYGAVPAGLGDHRAVFINLGVQIPDSLDNNEQNILDSYLASGGMVYLEQSDKWLTTNNSTFFNRFHADTSPSDEYELQNIYGEPGTLAEDMNFSFTSLFAADFDFVPVNPAYPVFSAPDGHKMQLAYADEYFRTIASIISFGSLSDGIYPSDKKTLMEKYLEFFGISDDRIKPFFHADKRVAGVLEDIQFFDDSYDSIISWQWSFPGGEPSSSSIKDPVVKYSDAGIFDVWLTVTGTGGQSSLQKKNYITIKAPEGISGEKLIEKITIYPNPCHGVFSIILPEKRHLSYRISIFDLLGKEVYTTTTTNPELRIKVPDIGKGIYLVVGFSDENRWTGKVIIN